LLRLFDTTRSRTFDANYLIVARMRSIPEKKLDLCSVEVCASVGVDQRASKPAKGFLAGSDGSTHCPYRRLCAAALGYRFRAWAGKLWGYLGTEIGDLLERLGTSLLGAYLVTYHALLRPTNPSMGLGPANTTTSSSFHTALGDIESIADAVLG